MKKSARTKQRRAASSRPSARSPSIRLEAILRAGAKTCRSVRLDPNDCAKLVGELVRLRAFTPSTTASQAKTWAPVEERAGIFRSTVGPTAGCPGCAAASMSGPLACHRHGLEALLADAPPCVCNVLGLARCLPCRIRRLERDLAALDTVSEAMAALQERFSEQAVMPSEVFTGTWMMLHGAVRCADMHRREEREDDRCPSTPAQVVPNAFRLDITKDEGGQWSVGASSKERGTSARVAGPLLSSAIACAVVEHAKGEAR